MNELVFIFPNTKEPFTTSDVIAECTGIAPRRIRDAIRKNEKELKQFGLLGAYQTESTGGRPHEIYHLNEQQATFLITLLKNTPEVVKFKAELVRQFYSMRQELQRIYGIKQERKIIRLNMTDQIKALPDSPHKQFKYSQFTNLAYLVAIGQTAKKIREDRGAKKTDTASDFLTATELEKVADIENKIGVMIEMGMDYGAIKEKLQSMLAISKEA